MIHIRVLVKSFITLEILAKLVEGRRGFNESLKRIPTRAFIKFLFVFEMLARFIH